MARYLPFALSLDLVRYPVLALVLLVPAPTIGALCALWLFPGPLGSAIYALAKGWLLLLPLLWTLCIDRRPPLSVIKTSKSSHQVGMVIGAALGLVIALAVVLIFLLLHKTIGIDAMTLKHVASTAGFGTPISFLLLGLYLSLINALLEEYVWRWFTYRAAASIFSQAAAVPLSALFFTFHHIVVLAAYFPLWLTFICSTGVFIGGCTWSYCFARFHSLWPGYLSHVIVDVAIMYVGWQLLFTDAAQD